MLFIFYMLFIYICILYGNIHLCILADIFDMYKNISHYNSKKRFQCIYLKCKI